VSCQAANIWLHAPKKRKPFGTEPSIDQYGYIWLCLKEDTPKWKMSRNMSTKPWGRNWERLQVPSGVLCLEIMGWVGTQLVRKKNDKPSIRSQESRFGVMDSMVPMVQGLGSNPGFPSTCLASTVPGKFQREIHHDVQEIMRETLTSFSIGLLNDRHALAKHDYRKIR